VRVSTVIQAQNIDVQQSIRKMVDQAARQYVSPKGLDIPVAFRVVAGMR
jgi:hypothetical protein